MGGLTNRGVTGKYSQTIFVISITLTLKVNKVWAHYIDKTDIYLFGIIHDKNILTFCEI
jgi:hypothetical protein